MTRTEKQIDTGLLARATLFTLTLHQFWNHRKVDSGKLAVDGGGDADRFRVSKKLIDCPQFEAVCKYINRRKSDLLDRCVPSFMVEGIYLVAISEVEEFEAYLKETERELKSVYLKDLARVYDDAVEASRAALGSEFNAKDYPSAAEVCSRFWIEWGWITFGVSDNLPEAVRAQESRKLKARFAEAELEISALLRANFAKILDHAIERLKTPIGEQPKKFKDATFESFERFFSTFKARNIVGDDQLEAIIEQAKGVLTGVNLEAVRNDASFRNSVVEKIEGVKNQVASLVELKPTRRFDLG